MSTSSTPEQSFILNLETKKGEYNTALSVYEGTRNTYLGLIRKFSFAADKTIYNAMNQTVNTGADTKEKCMDSCVRDIFCAAADFNPTTKKCSIYKNYNASDLTDLSGNYAIVPDSVTTAVQADIDRTKVDFDIQNADLSTKCTTLINILNGPEYKTYRDAQSQQNKDFIQALKEKKNMLQKDREYIDGTLFDEIFDAIENVKKSKMTADRNFYIQIVLSVVTVVVIVSAIYYLWPRSAPVPVPMTNKISSNPYAPSQPAYAPSQPAYVTRGGGKGLSNQSYFVIGGILLFSIIVSQLKSDLN
jgi:hypothetical protein